MLKKIKEISQIEIVRDHIQVRYCNKIIENGSLIAETIERECFPPDSDIEKLPEEIKPYAAIVFTEEAKQRYELLKDK